MLILWALVLGEAPVAAFYSQNGDSLAWPDIDAFSPLLPLRGWVYDALEQFATEGLLAPSSVCAWPLSRGEAAHLVRALEPREEVRTRVLDLLSAWRRALIPPPVMRIGRWDVPLHFYGDVLFSSLGSTRAFEENVDRYEGFSFAEGSTEDLRFSVGVGVGRSVGGVGVPRLLIRKGRTPIVSLERGYVNALVRGIGLLYGKAQAGWGVGYRGDFVLTDQGLSLPMLRIWGKRRTVALDGMVLGLKRPAPRDLRHSAPSIEHTLFTGLRVLWWPLPWLGLEGSMGNAFPQGYWREVLQVWKKNKAITRVAELGVQWYPRAGIKLYGAVASDDLWGSDVGGALWRGKRRIGVLWGLYLSDPLGDRKTDFRMEWARLDEHGQGNWYGGGYSSGGILLGHPMGWDDVKGPRHSERDLFIRIRHHWFSSTTVICEYDRGEADLHFEPFVVHPTPVWVEVKDYLSSVLFRVNQRFGEQWTCTLDIRFVFTLKEVMQTGALWSHGSDQMVVLRAGYRVL